MRISLEDIDLESDLKVTEEKDGDNSGAAVYEGDEDEWDTEFQSA